MPECSHRERKCQDPPSASCHGSDRGWHSCQSPRTRQAVQTANHPSYTSNIHFFSCACFAHKFQQGLSPSDQDQPWLCRVHGQQTGWQDRPSRLPAGIFHSRRAVGSINRQSCLHNPRTPQIPLPRPYFFPKSANRQPMAAPQDAAVGPPHISRASTDRLTPGR